MQLARVLGPLVSTQKQSTLIGAKLLLVQPITADDQPQGVALLAVDSVGTGVGEKVLIVSEGRAAGQAISQPMAPVDVAIIGVIDEVNS